MGLVSFMLFDYVHVFVFFSIHLHSTLRRCPVCIPDPAAPLSASRSPLSPPLRDPEIFCEILHYRRMSSSCIVPSALIVSVVARLGSLYAMICTLEVIIIAALIRPTLGFIGSSPIICHRSSESARFGAARARNSKRPDLIGEKRQNIGGAVVAQP